MTGAPGCGAAAAAAAAAGDAAAAGAAATAAGAEVAAGALTAAAGAVGFGAAVGGAGAVVGGVLGGAVGLEHAASSEPAAIAPADRRRKCRRSMRAPSVIHGSLPGEHCTRLYAHPRASASPLPPPAQCRRPRQTSAE